MEQRTCLKCNQPFESTGPGNRLCGTCHTENAKYALRKAHTSQITKDVQVQSLGKRIRRSQDRGDE